MDIRQPLSKDMDEAPKECRLFTAGRRERPRTREPELRTQNPEFENGIWRAAPPLSTGLIAAALGPDK
jgi:hypothetical protein